MNFPPYLGAAVGVLLCVVQFSAVVVQGLSPTPQPLAGLVMQAAMALMWGALGLRFWNKARVARLWRTQPGAADARVVKGRKT